MRDIRYYLVHALPRPQRRALVRRWCRRRCGTAPLEYPADLEHVRSLLIVLPEEVLDALYQVENVLSIKEHFSQASVSFLCNNEVAEYYHSIAADASFVEYNTAERYLFSRALDYQAAVLSRERFQACFLLEHHPHLSLLNLVGLSGARVRAGYEHAAEYPFLNHVVRLDGAARFLAERYCAMARSVGAAPARRAKLAVGREAADGVAHLLRDIRPDAGGELLCVDGCGLALSYGTAWTGQLFAALKSRQAAVCCPARHGCDESILKWLETQGVTVVPPLTVPRLAALLARSSQVLAGQSPMLRLAALLERPAIGILTAKERDAHLQAGGTVTAVEFEGAPDGGTAVSAAALVRTGGSSVAAR